MSDVNVVLSLGLRQELVAPIREVSPRLNVIPLSWAQRRVYRGGRQIGRASGRERV